MKRSNILALVSIFLGGIATVIFILLAIIFNVQQSEQIISPLNLTFDNISTVSELESTNQNEENASVANLNKLDSNILTLEVARTDSEKTTGLMNRTELDENSGMIFIYEPPQEVTFWMKDTFISLDIIYVSENNQIVKIYENTETNQTITRYPSVEEIKYVIEVNAGWVEQNNYSEGDLLEITFSKN